MNRENKRKTFEKGYYKTHRLHATRFTCKVCGRLCTPENAGSDHRNHCPNCLCQPPCGHRARRPGSRLRRHYGAGGRLGAQGRRVGHHPPLPPLRRAQLQPGGGGRQPHEAHEHRHEAPVRAAVPAGAHRGDDGPDGRRRPVEIAANRHRRGRGAYAPRPTCAI